MTETVLLPKSVPVRRNGDANKLEPKDRVFHDWYRFVLSFPPHLVREYVAKFGLNEQSTVLDPFCGTGTTIVECKKLGIPSIGIEAHPMAAFASRVKTSWSVNPDELLNHVSRIARNHSLRIKRGGFVDSLIGSTRPTAEFKPRELPPEQFALLLTDSISPIPLHKTLTLLDCFLSSFDNRFIEIEQLALAHALVNNVSNLRFGPEVGVGEIKTDAPLLQPWTERIELMAADLAIAHRETHPPAQVFCQDARDVKSILKPASIDAVITSPPYPNEKDYTRTTRLESVILGFINSKQQLRDLKQTLIRSNTRNVYVNDTDGTWITAHPEIERVAQAIESRRIELGKTSGFERLYHKVTRLYFGGMARHLHNLQPFLKPGAKLAYVVGDQASYLQVMIRTGTLLGEIAESLGYRVDSIELFRTRLATATKEQLREEVVVLTWPGKL